MTAAAPRVRRIYNRFLVFFVAGSTAVLGWAAALAGIKGVIALSGAAVFGTSLVATKRRGDLLLLAGVGSSAALMHKSFGGLAEIASGPPSIYVHTFDIMVFVLWMAWFVSGPEDMLEDLRRTFIRPAAWLPIAAFAAIIPSIAVAPNTTLAIAEFVRMSSMLMVFIFFAASITTKRQVVVVISALMIIAVVEAVVVAGQYVTTSALGLSVFGTPTILHNRFDGVTFARPFGTMAHPVFMGAYVGALALLAFSLAVNLRSPKLKWGALMVSAVAVSPLILASARSASFAIAIAFVVLAIALLMTGRLPAVTAGWWTLAGVTAAVVSSPYLIRLWNKSFRTEHFGTEWESRVELNAIAVRMFEDRPFFGHGLNNFEEVLPGYDRYGLIFADNPVHNLYLLNLAESGLFGFFGVLILGVGVVRVAIRVAKSQDRLLSAVGFAAASIYLFWALEEMLVFSLRQDHPRSLFFILTGLLFACDRMAGTDRVRLPRTPVPRKQASQTMADPKPAPELVAAGRSRPRVGSAALAVALVASVLTFAPVASPAALGQEPADEGAESVPTDAGSGAAADAGTADEGSAGAPRPAESVLTDPTEAQAAAQQEETPQDAPPDDAAPDDAAPDDAAPDDAAPEEEAPEAGAPQDEAADAAAAEGEAEEEEPLGFEPIPIEDLPRGAADSEAGLDIVYSAQSRLDGLRRIFVLPAGSDTPRQISPEDGRQYSWPSWAFNGNKVVFTARDAGETSSIQESIYWMNPDGSDFELLLEVPFQAAQPKVSSDGTTLVFAGRLEGTTFTRLYGWDMTSGLAWNLSQVGNEGFLDSDPSFSPDDGSVVFIDSQSGGVAVPGEIAIMAASGQNRRQITFNGLYDTDPQVTSDLGSVVSARYTGEGEPRDPDSPNPFQVVLRDFKIIEHDVASGAEIELTEGEACFLIPSDQFACAPRQGSSYLPKYTPDDRRVGYISILNLNTTCICAVDRTGTEPLVRYTDTVHVIDWFDWVAPGPVPPRAPDEPVRPVQLPDAIEKLFDFDVIELVDVPVESTSSDGSLSVVFSAKSRSTGTTRLYLLEAGNDTPIAISPDDGRIYDSPSFAFGGEKIVFSVREPSGMFELWWSNRDGSAMELLLSAETPLLTPSMSADGTTLTFGSLGLIYVWDLATGFIVNASAASSDAATDFDPDFGDGNDEILFTEDGELAVMSPAGQNRLVLTSNGMTDTGPAISTDRQSVVSARYLDGVLPVGGSVGDVAVVVHNRITAAERQLTEGLGCHAVPVRFACLPDQASGFFPLFTPDDQRVGFVGILSSRAVCICTIGVDGSRPVARWLSTDLAVGSFDWSARHGVPSSAVLTPIRPDQIVELVDFAVVDADDVPLVPRGGLDVVFAATSRSDGQSRIYVLAAGATTPDAVTPTDRRKYRWASWALGATKIVFSVQEGDGPEEIWWMNRDGTDARPLIAINSSVSEPRVSPDGQSLVFTYAIRGTSFTQVYRLDLATGWVENLSTVGGAQNAFDAVPSFNLRGTRLALMDQGRITVMAADGTQRRVVLSASDFVHADPALNADGSRLLASRRSATEPTGAFTAVLASTAGQPGERSLTSGNDCGVVPDSFSCLADGGMGLFPIFSPDSARVGYVAILSSTTMCICIQNVDGEANAGAGFRTNELIIGRFDWAPSDGTAGGGVTNPVRPELLLKDLLLTVAAADGAGIERTRADRFLTQVVDISGSVEPRDASASANGRVIVFTAEVDPDNPLPLLGEVEAAIEADSQRDVHYTINLRDEALRDLPLTRREIVSSQLFMVNSDGSGLRQLTTSQTEDPLDAIRDGDRRGNLLADVSPNGRYVVFTNISTLTEESFILRLDLRTGEVRSLTNATAGALPVHDTDPKWSPDGSQVAFVSDSWGSPEIWVMDADGSNARPVSNGVAGRFPAWSADGGSLSFAADNKLMVLDLDSGSITEFASHDGRSVSRSAWSSDGRFVAWIAFTEAGAADLYIRSTDGSRDLTKLTAGSAELGVDW